MKLTRSMEDYLEAILLLEKQNQEARVKDIADHLGVRMPSVTGALKNLRAKGLIDYEKNSFITLTGIGLEKAEEVVEKHQTLFQFLHTILGLEAEDAEEEACRIEHSLGN